jgi:DNA-binding HxlR family transcriptional regulator
VPTKQTVSGQTVSGQTPSGQTPSGRTLSGDALSAALAIVGDRWTLLVVDALNGGPRRFAELASVLPEIATNVLTQRLRRLEADGLVLAVPYSTRPRRFAYELTEPGRELGGVVRLLAQWSADRGGGTPDTPGHSECGTPLVARWWCPTCDQLSESGPGEAIWV